MKKYVFAVMLILLAVQPLMATMQEPDEVFYQQKKYQLLTHWAYPSPLEMYYHTLDVRSPFTMLHTANYRGFVATWRVIEDELYLQKVLVQETQIPLEFLFGEEVKNGKVFASWFTGMIRLYSDSSDILLNIKQGHVQHAYPRDQQDEEIRAKYQYILTNWKTFLKKPQRTVTPEETEHLQQAAETVRHIREEALGRELATRERARQKAEQRSRQIYQHLEGFEHISQYVNIEKSDEGYFLTAPGRSLSLELSFKQEQLVDSAAWYNPIVGGKAEYTWDDFWEIYQTIEAAASRHHWLSTWKQEDENQRIEARILGKTPSITRLEKFVTPAWSYAGLKGTPRYELVLVPVYRRGRRNTQLFLGDDDPRALIVHTYKGDSLHWLDTIEVSYHPTQEIPEYVVVTPQGEWTKYPPNEN